MKIKRLLIFFIIVLSVAGAIYVYINQFASEKTAKIEINSNIESDVFIDGENVGHLFPISRTYEPKMVVVKMQSYETNVYLQPGVKTFVNRYFEEENQYGEIISFEETGQSKGNVVVISDPVGSNILLDSKEYGKTPLSLNDIDEGEHELEIRYEGYEGKKIKINTYNGYKLLANIALRGINNKPQIVLPKSTATVIKILDTPNGFLRVRKEPTTQSEEVFRVKTNEEYELKSLIKKNGWYEIRIDATRSGWISDVYAASSSAEVKD